MSMIITGRASRGSRLDDRKNGAHRYWRARVSSNNGHASYLVLGELQLFDVSDQDTPCTDSGATDVYSTSDGTAAQAFDTYPSTNWKCVVSRFAREQGSTSNTFYASFPHYLQVEFVDPKDIVKAVFLNTGNDQGIEAAPTGVDIQYSDDGIEWFTRGGKLLEWPSDNASNPFSPGDEYYQTIDLIGGIQGSATLPVMTSEGYVVSGDVVDSGGQVQLPAFSSTGLIDNTERLLPAITSEATGVSGNLSVSYIPIELPSLEGSGTLAPGQFSESVNPLPGLIGSGEGYQYGDLAGVVLPSLSGDAAGVGGNSGEVFGVLPGLSTSAEAVGPNDLFGGVLPGLIGNGIGASGTYGPIVGRIPPFSGAGTLSDTSGTPLPAFTSSATGAGGQAATIIAQLGSITTEVAGYGEGDLTGGILPAIIGQGIGASGTYGPVFARLPKLSGSGTLSDTGGTPLPAFKSEAEGSSGQAATIIAQLGSITAEGGGYGEGDLTGGILPGFTGNGIGIGGRFGPIFARLPSFESTGVLSDTSGIRLPSFTSEAYGAGGQAATIIAQLGGLTSESQGYGEGDLTGGILPSFTGNGVGIGGRFGPIFARLPSFESVGVLSDTTGIRLPGITSEAEGSSGQAATVIAQLGSITSESEGYGEGDLTGGILPSFTGDGVGIGGRFGPINMRLPSFESTGVLSDTTGTRLPSITGEAAGSSGQAATIIARLGKLSGEGAGYGEGDLIGGVLPSFTSTGEAIGGRFGPIRASLPSLTGAIEALGEGEDLTTLPGITSEAEGQVSRPGQLFGYLPSFSTAVIGEFVDIDAVGESPLSASLPMFTTEIVGVPGNQYQGAGELPGLVMAAEGVTGQLGQVIATLPAITGAGEGIAEVLGSIGVTLPAIRIIATTSVDVAAPMSGEAIAMNVKHKGVTAFTDYGFNSYAEFSGMTLACSDEGLFALVGDDDNGAIINASVRLGKLDFDNQQLKTVDQCYVGYEASGDLTLSVKADDGTQYEYALSPNQVIGRHTSRTKLGRGLKGRYFQLGIDNVDGADFSIDTFEPEPRVLKRRVR